MSIARVPELDEKDITGTGIVDDNFQGGFGNILYGSYKGEQVLIWEYFLGISEAFDTTIQGLAAVQQRMKENHIPIKGVVKNKQWIVCEAMDSTLQDLFGEVKFTRKPMDDLLCFRIMHEICSAERARQGDASIERELNDKNFFLVKNFEKKLADAKTLADNLLTMSPIVVMGLTGSKGLSRAGGEIEKLDVYSTPPGYVDESTANTPEQRDKFNKSRDETAVWRLAMLLQSVWLQTSWSNFSLTDINRSTVMEKPKKGEEALNIWSKKWGDSGEGEAPDLLKHFIHYYCYEPNIYKRASIDEVAKIIKWLYMDAITRKLMSSHVFTKKDDCVFAIVLGRINTPTKRPELVFNSQYRIEWLAQRDEYSDPKEKGGLVPMAERFRAFQSFVGLKGCEKFLNYIGKQGVITLEESDFGNTHKVFKKMEQFQSYFEKIINSVHCVEIIWCLKYFTVGHFNILEKVPFALLSEAKGTPAKTPSPVDFKDAKSAGSLGTFGQQAPQEDLTPLRFYIESLIILQELTEKILLNTSGQSNQDLLKHAKVLFGKIKENGHQLSQAEISEIDHLLTGYGFSAAGFMATLKHLTPVQQLHSGPIQHGGS